MKLIAAFFFIYIGIVESSKLTKANHSPVPPITFAASYGNTSEVLRLLKAGAEVDERDWVGQTALHMAAKFGQPEACSVLLQQGADPMAKNADYAETPLHNTGKTGNKHIFKLLFKYGVDVNAFGGNSGFPGGTPLIYCVEFSNSVDAAQLLLENGANISAIDSQKRTALHLAVANNNFKMAEMLLRKRAFVDSKDENGNTPLNWLAVQKQPQVPLMALLLNFSADVNTQNNKGKTPLDHALELENFPVILYLVENGAKWGGKLKQPTMKEDYPFVSTLAFATAFGETNDVDAMLKKFGPHGIVNERDFLNQTALHISAMYDRHIIAALLLKWNPDVNALDGNGMTAMHHAAKCGSSKMLSLLIDAKANIEAEHPDYGTPLSTAARFANAFVPAVKALLKAGAIVNTADSTVGYTPLHWATTNQNLKIALLLLQHGANIEAKTVAGESPLNLLMGSVCCYPQLPAVQFLLDHGAKINSRDNNGCTPLCKAKQAGKRDEVLQFLIDRGGVY